uniref:Uncharacterized protein n=1 Tax=uncultured Acidobacteria bacterium A2 TaxID=1036852 RepID=F8TTG2_9BACT|nr:hypothetical protein [uncultured Acidobacteria bacterium A2]
MHLRKGKVQRVRASLKRVDYNTKRDFVAFGADGDIDEFKTVALLPESSAGWKFLPQASVKGDDWKQPGFDDAAWRTGKAPIGYGEEELKKRNGTTIPEQGQNFVFRRSFDLPGGVLDQKGATVRLCVASDDSAEVYINGQLADNDPVPDHEPIYWNQDIEIPAKLLKPGKNVIAVLVKNKQGSSDLFLDVELSVQVPVPKKPKK